MVPKKLVDRFNSKWKLDAVTGCWQWTASAAGRGVSYGQIKLPGERRQIYAHRLAYLIHKGDVPEGMSVCHTCDNRLCVNPEHLFLGTTKDNQQDMKSKGRSLFGEKNGKAKLTEELAREVIRLLRTGLPQIEIAERVGIGQMQVSRINTGERWGHLNSGPIRKANARKRLSVREIKQVRAMLNSGVSCVQVAKHFGCTPITIGRIKNGKRWADIT